MAAAVDVVPLDLAREAAAARLVFERAAGVRAPEREQIFVRHAAQPGYLGVAVRSDAAGDPPLVALAYGTRALPGAYWYDRVRPELERRGSEGVLDGAFAIAEVAVLPERQGRGLGRAVVDALWTAAVGAGAVGLVLGAYVDNPRARRLYASYGFRDVTDAFAFSPGDRPYTVMAADPAHRPARSPARPGPR